MNESIFKNSELSDKLVAICDKWLGTPFSSHGACVGSGVNCGRLVYSVLHELGVLPKLDIPRKFTSKSGGEMATNLIETIVAGSEGIYEVDTVEIGDEVHVTEHRELSNHLALVYNTNTQTIFHAWPNKGVIISPYRAVRKYKHKIYRFVS